MTKIPKIELHGEASDGGTYVLNRLSLENAKAQESLPHELESRLAMLRSTAADMALRWQKHLPNDKIRVVEL